MLILCVWASFARIGFNASRADLFGGFPSEPKPDVPTRPSLSPCRAMCIAPIAGEPLRGHGRRLLTPRRSAARADLCKKNGASDACSAHGVLRCKARSFASWKFLSNASHDCAWAVTDMSTTAQLTNQVDTHLCGDSCMGRAVFGRHRPKGASRTGLFQQSLMWLVEREAGSSIGVYRFTEAWKFPRRRRHTGPPPPKWAGDIAPGAGSPSAPRSRRGDAGRNIFM